MKRFMILIATGALGLAVGVLLPLTTLHRESPQTAHVQWASPATTVAEEDAEADVIVRVRIDRVLPARVGTIFALPPASQKPDVKDLVIPFTDSVVRVREVYKGSVGEELLVMQTGGLLSKTVRHPLINTYLEDDPIFVTGGEHILFLKNISGDQIHAKGRQLYRIVNGAGRYDVNGDTVTSRADFPSTYTPPKTTVALVGQIRQALALP